MSSTKDGMNLGVCKEAGATRLLTKASLSTMSVPSSRQVESARLLKLVPDLSQKEVSRFVTGKRREKPLARNLPAIFPEKRSMQKLCSPEVTKNQLDKAPMPARSAALSNHDALRMLKELGTAANLDSDPTTLLTASTERTSPQRVLNTILQKNWCIEHLQGKIGVYF